MASRKHHHISYDKTSNRYQARYMVTLPDGTRKRQSVYGKTLEEAQEKYNKAVAEAIIGNPVKTSNTTLGQYLTTWIESVKKIKESTREGYRGEIRKHIIPNIGGIRLSCLTTQQVQNMMNKLQKQGVSVRTTQILKNILSKALKSAEAQNLVKRGIIQYVELDTHRPKERKIWNEKECQSFLEAIKGHKYYFFFLLYISCGLRRGEAIPLTWEDVDFEEKTITINKQYTYVGRKLVVCSPKTESSVRTLPMPPHIEALLLELRKANSRAGSLIISNNGELVKPSSVNYEFEKILKQNNLSEVVLHSLRHFVATAFSRSNVVLKDAQMILGHSSPLTTIQFYQHSTPESKREALTTYAEKMKF